MEPNAHSESEAPEEEAEAEFVARLESLGSKPAVVVWGADEAETKKWAEALNNLTK